ncbi:MAG: hypothetical protein WBD97_25735, partial [Pseudolabrys sp.]
MAVLTVASFVLTGLTVDLRSNPSLLLSISGILAFSFFYRYWRPNPHLRALTEVAAQFLLSYFRSSADLHCGGGQIPLRRRWSVCHR